MVRLPRLNLADIPQHVIQRGNNRGACFFSDADYAVYLDKLVLDRERVFYCGKAGFCQNSSLFSSNSQLFSSNNEKFCSKPGFPSLRILSRSSTKLREFSLKYKVAIHSYVLMTNHVHLLLTPSTEDGVSRLIQTLSSYYVRYVNQTYDRTGTLWEEVKDEDPC